MFIIFLRYPFYSWGDSAKHNVILWPVTYKGMLRSDVPIDDSQVRHFQILSKKNVLILDARGFS